MARKGRARKRRTTYTYLNRKRKKEITELAQWVPSLEKLKGKDRLTAAQQAQVTRAKKSLRHTETYRRVTDKQAKLLKQKGEGGILVGKGVRAIRLRNTASNAKIKILSNGMIVTSNGRTWEYHPVDADADTLNEYGKEQLERDNVEAVGLWTNRGRTNETTDDPEQWEEFLYQRFTKYADAQEFTQGVVVLIKEKRKRGK